jgi:hypothetical protein
MEHIKFLKRSLIFINSTLIKISDEVQKRLEPLSEYC